MNKKIASNADNSVELKRAALDWWDHPLLRMQVKTNNIIKQQSQQTRFTSKTLNPFFNKKNLQGQNSVRKNWNKTKRLVIH